MVFNVQPPKKTSSFLCHQLSDAILKSGSSEVGFLEKLIIFPILEARYLPITSPPGDEKFFNDFNSIRTKTHLVYRNEPFGTWADRLNQTIKLGDPIRTRLAALKKVRWSSAQGEALCIASFGLLAGPR